MPFISVIVANLFHRIWMPLKTKLKTQTRPVSGQLGTGGMANLTRLRKALLLETAFLRQQLLILERLVKPPKITCRDRLKLSNQTLCCAGIVSASSISGRRNPG